jgi:hypothetical protein
MNRRFRRLGNLKYAQSAKSAVLFLSVVLCDLRDSAVNQSERFDPQFDCAHCRHPAQMRKPERPRSDSRCHRVGVVRYRTDSVGKSAPGLGPPRSARHGKSGDCLSRLTVDADCFLRHRSPNGVAWRFPDWTAVGFRCPGPVPRISRSLPSVTRQLVRRGSDASVIGGLSPRGPMRHVRRR